ncbi:unnamed protein product [Echinostoma caproni]|uniref:DUF4806 domain-containing protein n=1 Tax=Echinostoma caproni TaxID=27848 RepID=A0A183A777_9TREM|nr:unnamed protein product [Echinostoma caproni]
MSCSVRSDIDAYETPRNIPEWTSIEEPKPEESMEPRGPIDSEREQLLNPPSPAAESFSEWKEPTTFSQSDKPPKLTEVSGILKVAINSVTSHTKQFILDIEHLNEKAFKTMADYLKQQPAIMKRHNSAMDLAFGLVGITTKSVRTINNYLDLLSRLVAKPTSTHSFFKNQTKKNETGSAASDRRAHRATRSGDDKSMPNALF